MPKNTFDLIIVYCIAMTLLVITLLVINIYQYRRHMILTDRLRRRERIIELMLRFVKIMPNAFVEAYKKRLMELKEKYTNKETQP